LALATFQFESLGGLEVADTTTSGGSCDGKVGGARWNVLCDADFFCIVFTDVASTASAGRVVGVSLTLKKLALFDVGNHTERTGGE
jgi:hypothetical protein